MEFVSKKGKKGEVESKKGEKGVELVSKEGKKRRG